MEPKQLLIQSFEAAVAAADPLKILPNHLPAPPSGKTLVIGAGKAAASMALAVERHWPAGAALEGLVVTRHGHGLPTRRIKVIEAGHPVPDESGESAAKEILQRVGHLAPDDLLLALISGGGSALLSLPGEAGGQGIPRSGSPRRNPGNTQTRGRDFFPRGKPRDRHRAAGVARRVGLLPPARYPLPDPRRQRHRRSVRSGEGLRRARSPDRALPGARKPAGRPDLRRGMHGHRARRRPRRALHRVPSFARGRSR